MQSKFSCKKVIVQFFFNYIFTNHKNGIIFNIKKQQTLVLRNQIRPR